jgi:transcriptional regulator with XRE-family HTH domain
MSQKLLPMVCLDGAAVRRIREEKKLTQLYVAKVVGVTTDTISRWENNRYPSIKRENAVRLAEALEVAVEEVLQGGTGECLVPEPEPTLPARRRPAWMPYLSLLLVAAAAGGYFFLRGQQPEPLATILAERTLAGFAAPGSVIPVLVEMEAPPETRGFILREHFPAGWKLVEATPPPSSLDNEEGSARWIVKPGDTRKRIAYLLRVDEAATVGTQAAFSGDVVANPDGRSHPVAIGGVGTVTVAVVQWADLNGDGVIDDTEMLQASNTIEQMKGVHLDWNQLEDIWDAGGYRWDQKRQQFVPVRPPHRMSLPPQH